MNKSLRIEKIDYIYFFVVVIYAAMALPATKSMIKPSGGVIAYSIPWIATILMVIRHRVTFQNRNLYIISFIYWIWVLFQFFKFSIFYEGAFMIYGNILIAYILIKIYGVKMLFIYERIVTILSVIAIIGWIFQVLTPSFFTSFMKMTSFYDFPSGNTISANNIFFSLSNYERGLNGGYLLPRNSGFSWEPGRYSSMIVFAMFFNVIRLRFNLIKNKGFWILFIALITTQSTTGLSALLIVFSLVIFNKKLKTRINLLFLIFIPLLIGAIYLPFMGEKISNLWFDYEDVEKVNKMAVYREGSENIIVPQRFTAILFELMNIKNDPITGYGVAPANSYVQKSISSAISLPGGAFRIFSQFGIILAILCYIALFKSSLYIKNIFGFNGGGFFFILFTLLSISYPFWDVPFFSSLWLLSLFKGKDKSILFQDSNFFIPSAANKA